MALLACLVVGFLLPLPLFASTISPLTPANPLDGGTREPEQLQSDARGEASSAGQQIIQIDPGTLRCNATVDFKDTPGEDPPGTNYDQVLVFTGATFAERFLGQTLTYNNTFDVLSGTPTPPLTLQVGTPFQNINVIHINIYGRVIDGLGPTGHPNSSAIGEGSIAVLFDMDQSEFGFRIVGAEGPAGGTATINFFRRDGSLIDTVVFTSFFQLVLAFQRVGNIRDIAGISIHNDDPDGIAFDDFCYSFGETPIEGVTWGQVKMRYRP